jgi:dihydroorotate dehydrogenase
LLVKIAPDLDDDPIRALVDALRECGVDGITATNTTIGRPNVREDPVAEEAGGLSGAPLRDRATAVVRLVRETAGPDLPIIAVGGILNAADAVEKMQAGADLVQIYTGFIYRGPGLIRDAAKAIATASPTMTHLS